MCMEQKKLTCTHVEHEHIHRSHAETFVTANFSGFKFVPMDDTFVWETLSGSGVWNVCGVCVCGVCMGSQQERQSHVKHKRRSLLDTDYLQYKSLVVVGESLLDSRLPLCCGYLCVRGEGGREVCGW